MTIRYSLILMCGLLLCSFISVASSQENHTIEEITLILNSTLGWNYTNPGPTVQFLSSDTVVFNLRSDDYSSHTAFCPALGTLFWTGWTHTETFITFTVYPTQKVWESKYYDGNAPFAENWTFSGDLISRPTMTQFSPLYHSTNKSSNWNPSADFDNNGKISLSDLVGLANLYRQRTVWIGELPMPLDP